MIERTDEETGELVRAWLQRYGLAIVAGIALAIALIAGYEWWQGRQLQHAGAASTKLMALSDAVGEGQLARAEELYSDIDDARLGAFAALLLATLYSEQKQDDKALALLARAGESDDALVAQTAHWQLAQRYIARADYAAAEQQLQALKGSAYERQIPLLHGVIAQRQDDKQAALENYRQALSSNSDPVGLLEAQVAALEGALAVEADGER